MGMFEASDLALLRLINSAVGAHPAFDKAIELAADWYFFRCAPLVAFLWWAWFAKSAEARRKIIAGVFAAAISSVTSRALQVLLFVHLRPFNVAAQYGLTVPPSIKTNWGTGSSFPSDTTTLHFALAMTVFSVSRRAGIAAFAWVALMIALPRVYLTYHWPSDIVSGALLGIAMTIAFQRWAVTSIAAVRITAFTETAPQAFYAAAFLITYQLTVSFEDLVVLLRMAAAKV